MIPPALFPFTLDRSFLAKCLRFSGCLPQLTTYRTSQYVKYGLLCHNIIFFITLCFSKIQNFLNDPLCFAMKFYNLGSFVLFNFYFANSFSRLEVADVPRPCRLNHHYKGRAIPIAGKEIRVSSITFNVLTAC